jgi:preprotein translocase subunit SecA
MFDSFLTTYLNQSTSKYSGLIKEINDLEPKIQKLTDQELKNYAQQLRQKLISTGDEKLITREAFALVREASVRVLSIRPFDVQLLGGLVLNEGKIAEMKTGEGKTIVALFPTFLNALYGKGVQVVTVNDYLAKRDAEVVGRVHNFLGLTTGLIQENMNSEERRKNYACDIVYVTNNELGFDYLRDNMAFTNEELVQRSFFYCVVDEVDSILIDEARTPLIISGPRQTQIDKYKQTTKLANALKKNIHYLVDEKNQNITILASGVDFCEQALEVSDLYDKLNPWIQPILNSIKAKELFQLNTHYICDKNGEIIIVDEFTGRTMPGRRWSDGLHQAVEAKENVQIQEESQTLASITYQNLFLLYEKLSGMTGTAKTEEIEFEKIYKLEVVAIPTNKKVQRKDFPDLIYKNQYLKWQAIARECAEMNELKRPVLVGTTTIEKSELLAALLTEYGLAYRLLNARPENIQSESEIVAQAGCRGSITIATNMAGRGTDIALGGNCEILLKTSLRKFLVSVKNTKQLEAGFELANSDPVLHAFVPYIKNAGDDWLKNEENFNSLIDCINNPERPVDPSLQEFKNLYKTVLDQQKEGIDEEKNKITRLGGLHVIGTERHESRRIDNQLRGRSGRQGDPGSSRFFLSLDDRLLQLFGGDQLRNMMQNISFPDDTPIQSPLLNNSLETAQKKVEAYYFDVRKQLFDYDQALTQQRNTIYLERKRILEKENLRDWIIEYGERSLKDILRSFKSGTALKTFNQQKIQEFLGLHYPIITDLTEEDNLLQLLKQQFQTIYSLREIQLEAIGTGLSRDLERSFLLQQIDYSWTDHLEKIALLRDAIRWRSYGQRNPLTDYKKESYNLFLLMLTRIRQRIIYFILRSKIIMEFDD